MNFDHIGVNWKQAKVEIKQQWNQLSNDHLDMVSGSRNQLLAKIHECYGIAYDDAERQVKAWEAKTRICLFETVQRPSEHTSDAQL